MMARGFCSRAIKFRQEENSIKNFKKVLALVLVLAVSAAVFLALGSCLREALTFFEELADRAGLSSELLIPLYKTLGIALVVRIGGGLCRDAGESALSSVLEAAGALCTLLAALPLFRNVLDLLTELMK